MASKRNAALPGPVSLFRGKVRKPVSLTLTPEHHVKVNRAMERLKLSRADVIALLIDKHADNIELPEDGARHRQNRQNGAGHPVTYPVTELCDL